MNIDIDKYNIKANWITELENKYKDEKYKIKNQKTIKDIAKTNRQLELLNQYSFYTIKIVVNIFPKEPVETVYEVDPDSLNNSNDDFPEPKERKIFRKPEKIEIKDDGNYSFVNYTYKDGFEHINGIITKKLHYMEFEKMIDHLREIIMKNYLNPEELIDVIIPQLEKYLPKK